MYTNGLKDRFGSPLVSQKDVEQQISQSLDIVNERIALTEENLTKVSGDLEETREEIVTEIKEDLSSKADLVLNNTFSGEQVFSNDVTFGKTIYLNNVEDPDMSTTLDGSSLSTTNVTTFTINNNDLTFTDGEIVIGDKVLTFDGEDEVIPANSVTDEARMFARVAQESATVAETSMETAVASASAASISETNAANSATSAAESATEVIASVETINEHELHLRAMYRNLKDGTEYFSGDTSLTVFQYDMPKLQTAFRMFFRVPMKRFDKNISALIDGTAMFAQSGLEEFDAPLDSLQEAHFFFSQCKSLRSFKTTSLENLSNGDDFFEFCYSLNLGVWEYDLPNLKSGANFFGPSKATGFRGRLDKLQYARGMCSGKSGFTLFEADLPSLSYAPNFMNQTILDKASALRILTTIPAYSGGEHPITIGIHIDHQADEEVLAAIEAATAKGWTVTTQWNGTATASTFALRPTPTLPVYVKCEQSEDGRYADASGTLFEVEWGHEVHSPDGKNPEELGYTIFNSLDEAMTTWGLTEYNEIPQEEQINN